ncbi:MAG: hypothetical protein JXC32_05600 [Anaerolineae bacterium]|nr:hypothetical protein [Anaerolineae bacterium]
MPQPAEPHSANPSGTPLPRLLRTKLLVPQVHPEVVPRPRLLSRLDGGLRCPLTLVSAAAGFGKTTLLSAWIASRGMDAAWVSLDERDDDPRRFWAYVIAALQTQWPEVGATAAVMLQTPQFPPIEGVLTELLNDVASQEGQHVLVLDDYHVIDAEAIHHGIGYLVDHLPPQLRLVLSSRTDPPLPLALLRARRQVLELRSADLRFTSDEASAFLNEVMRLSLDANDLAALDTLIEGWAAGLQLAALSLQDVADVGAFVGSFSGSHRYVFDYLAHEIFYRQPETLRAFLLRTALLPRLSSDLCEAVTGHENGQALLEALERANLFVLPLDRERHWYRYHRLFADFLRAQMRDQLPSDEIADLHRRASHWFGMREEYDDAISHALAAEDVPATMALVRRAAKEQFKHSELQTFLGWLGALPREAVARDAYLSMAGAWAALALGQNEPAESYIRSVELALGSPDTATGKQLLDRVAGVRAEVSVIRASLAFNRMDLSAVKRLCHEAQTYMAEGQDGVFNDRVSLLGIAAFDQALAREFSGETDAAVRAFEQANVLLREDENSHVLPMSISHLAQLQVQRGQLRAAAATYEAACDSVDVGPARSPLGGLAFTGMGSLLYEWNHLDAAETYLRQGLELGQRWSEWEILLAGYTGLVRIALARGQVACASEVLEKCASEAERMAVAWTQPVVQGLQAVLALRRGEVGVAEQWAAQTRHLDAGPIPYPLEAQALLLAQICVALGQVDRGLDLVSRLLPTVRQGGRYGRVIEARVIEACARAAQGDRPTALTALAEALQLAEPEGYVRTFVDAGDQLIALLHEVDVLPGYTARLLAAASESKPERMGDTTKAPQMVSGASDAPIPPEALSDRELEVLALMAEGMTNQAIADSLFISINTVKTHARHVYEKLGVHNRAQAAHKAAELHLLD